VGSQILTAAFHQPWLEPSHSPSYVSPVFEVAFGYRGKLPFLEFGYNAASHQFGFSDGGGDLPSDPNLWSWFLWSRHCCLKPNIPPFTGGSRQELKGPPLLLQRGAP
jgi:hypothetical protein